MSQPNISGQVPETFQAAPEPGMPPEVREALDRAKLPKEPEQAPEPVKAPEVPERIDFPDGRFVRFWRPDELESGDLRPALRGLEMEGRIGWVHGLAPGAIREWNLTAKKTGKPLLLPKDDSQAMDRLAPKEYAGITNVLMTYIDLVVPEDPQKA
ncbi:hypothetical protein [Streptomyces mirabilis]|uniref:hypothetical protein n=1 Tax=Streptomyces mirabilis TaxID=68239 RepID=UPI0036D7A8A0